MDFESEKLLAAFRGVPFGGTWGGRRKIKSLEGVLDRVIDQCGIEKPSVEQMVMDQWRSIIGERFAHRCGPSSCWMGRCCTSRSPILRFDRS